MVQFDDFLKPFLIAVGFVEHGITAKHLNLTRKQFDMFHQNQAKPPLALMESTFPRMDKIGNIFTKDGDDDVSFSSPALEKIKWVFFLLNFFLTTFLDQ